MIDRSISLELDWKNLAPINLLSARQRDEGGPLNREQSAATYHYLSTGRLPDGIDVGNSDSEFSHISDADNSIAPSSARKSESGSLHGSSHSGSNQNLRRSFNSNSNSSSRGNVSSSTAKDGSKVRNSHSSEKKKNGEPFVVRQHDFPYTNFELGQTVEVQDLFRSKQNEGVKVKWRLAEITGINENAGVVKIHYIGWDPKWDEEIDVVQDRERIREYIGPELMEKSVAPRSRSFKDKKQKRKSATALNFNSLNQLQTVAEGSLDDRSEKSSPSVSKTNSGIFSPNTSGSRIFHDALSQMPDGSPARDPPIRSISSLDAVIEDDNEGLKQRKSELSIDEKIKVAMERADNEAIALSKKVANTLSQKADDSTAPLNSQRGTRATPRGTLRSRRISFPAPAQLPADVFKQKLEASGMFIKQVVNDGNSLFRAISHQLHLTEIKHQELRLACVKHMLEHKERFALYSSINFNEHVKKIAEVGYSGDDLEIKVMEEVLDRVFHVYSKDVMNLMMEPVPKDINEDERLLLKDVKPIKILSLGSGQYYSVVNELDPFEMKERSSHLIRNARVDVFKMNLSNE
jgi:hypothetical protein